MNIIEKILENRHNTNFDIEPLIHSSLHKKIDDLKLAIDGFITPEQANKLKIIKKHYEELASCKLNLEKVILSLSMPYTEDINLILTVPSFKNLFLQLLLFQK